MDGKNPSKIQGWIQKSFVVNLREVFAGLHEVGVRPIAGFLQFYPIRNVRVESGRLTIQGKQSRRAQMPVGRR